MDIKIDSTFINSEELLSEIKSKLDSMDDKELKLLREENHQLYYNAEINFLKTVDRKYKAIAKDILDKYNSINSHMLLKDDIKEAKKNNDLLRLIDENIKSLKEEIKKDLLSIIDYIDKCFSNIDISNVTKSSPLGILILNKYDALKIYSSNIDAKDLNRTMKRQSKRLIYMQELNELIFKYNNSYTMYNKDNTVNLLNNMYVIVSSYNHLLTTVEYQYTKEAIKKVLSYKFDFIDKYIHTYKIIVTKIWLSSFTENFYFIRSLDLSRKDIFLMNSNNLKDYDDTGYVCDIPRYFISYFQLTNLDIISFPLPNTIDGKYRIDIKEKNVDDIKLRAIYTTKESTKSKILPVIYLKNETSNS